MSVTVMKNGSRARELRADIIVEGPLRILIRAGERDGTWNAFLYTQGRCALYRAEPLDGRENSLCAEYYYAVCDGTDTVLVEDTTMIKRGMKRLRLDPDEVFAASIDAMSGMF
jgi:hypothetical protein